MKAPLFTALFCSLLLGACADDSNTDSVAASSLEQAKSTAIEKIESGKETISYTVDSAKVKTEEVVTATKEKVETMVSTAKEKAETSIDSAQNIIGDGSVTKGMIEDKKDELKYKLGQ